MNAHHPLPAASDGSDTELGRVLIVDDNQDAADTLGLLLRLLGADVRIAGDGPSALHACTALPPDVVLLDIGLPGMDGLEVARRLRLHAQQAQRQPPLLIAVTGCAQEEDAMRSRAAGVAHHLVKPVDIDALQALLVQQARKRAPRP